MRGMVAWWAAIIRKKKKLSTILRSPATAAQRGRSSKGSAVFVQWSLIFLERRRYWRLDQREVTTPRTTGARGLRSPDPALIRSVLFADRRSDGPRERAAQLAG